MWKVAPIAIALIVAGGIQFDGAVFLPIVAGPQPTATATLVPTATVAATATSTPTEMPTVTPAPTPTPTEQAQVPCYCDYNRYNCSDFATHNAAQTCFNYCVALGKGDIHKLDSDSDGLACELLP